MSYLCSRILIQTLDPTSRPAIFWCGLKQWPRVAFSSWDLWDTEFLAYSRNGKRRKVAYVALSWSDDLKIREISQTGIQHNPPTASSTDPLSGGPQRHRFGGSVAVFVELRGSRRAAGCPQIATPSLQKYLSVGTGWLFTNQISDESVQWNENEWNLGAEFVLVSEQNLAWFSERKFTKMGVYTSITHQAKYW